MYPKVTNLFKDGEVSCVSRHAADEHGGDAPPQAKEAFGAHQGFQRVHAAVSARKDPWLRVLAAAIALD
jgi:hypothetical protein